MHSGKKTHEFKWIEKLFNKIKLPDAFEMQAIQVAMNPDFLSEFLVEIKKIQEQGNNPVVQKWKKMWDALSGTLNADLRDRNHLFRENILQLIEKNRYGETEMDRSSLRNYLSQKNISFEGLVESQKSKQVKLNVSNSNSIFGAGTDAADVLKQPGDWMLRKTEDEKILELVICEAIGKEPLICECIYVIGDGWKLGSESEKITKMKDKSRIFKNLVEQITDTNFTNRDFQKRTTEPTLQEQLYYQINKKFAQTKLGKLYKPSDVVESHLSASQARSNLYKAQTGPERLREKVNEAKAKHPHNTSPPLLFNQNQSAAISKRKLRKSERKSEAKYLIDRASERYKPK